MTDKKDKEPDGPSLVEKHGFDKVMGAFLAVKPKGKKKPATTKKEKRREPEK